MKTLTMDYEEYRADMITASAAGLLEGREKLRRELGPVLDELMNLTRLEQVGTDNRFSLPMSGASDAYRRRIRELMIESGLIKKA
jgi:hypothetical protein